MKGARKAQRSVGAALAWRAVDAKRPAHCALVEPGLALPGMGSAVVIGVRFQTTGLPGQLSTAR